MLTQKSGAARRGRPTVDPHPPVRILPPVYHTPGGMSRGDLEELLTTIWDEPANIIDCYIGGHGPDYYARSESNWMSVDFTPAGFVPLWDTAESDYADYNDMRRAAARGMA